MIIQKKKMGIMRHPGFGHYYDDLDNVAKVTFSLEMYDSDP